MIKLIYIRGISAYDTPYFSSKLEQYDFFDDINGVEIDAYYPPHYTNTIKLDRDDVDDISQYNYLILYFNNKNYFYFLDSINYINEDVYEVRIVMDTIQTYMFDIVWNESLVSRKSIKRWNGNEINRDYIRENLSKTSKKLFNYESIECEDFFILQSSYNYTLDSNATTLKTKANNSYSANGCYYYLLPIPKYNKTIVEVNLIRTGATPTNFRYIGSSTYIDYTLQNFVKDPYTLNLYYCKNIHLSNLIKVTHRIEVESGVQKEVIDIYETDDFNFFSVQPQIRKPRDYTHPEDTYDAINGYCINIMDCNWYKYEYDEYVQFTNTTLHKNNSTNVDFDISMIPQLIDENYIEFSFGERMCVTRFPLHYSKTNRFSLYNNYDIFSGFRNYKIQEYDDNVDRYLTTTPSTTLESLDLYNDAWENYQAQHKGDLTIGVKSQIAKNIYSAVGGTVGSASSIVRGNDNVGSKSSLGEYYGFNMISSKTSVANALISTAVIRSELWQTQDNMESVPDTSRCGNTYYNDYINNSLETITTILVSEDIESVGRKLEYHGYKVSEYIRGNLFEECNIRYYYNIIQVDNIYIDLSVLTTYDILNEIKDRFISGIRLWNMEHNSYITEGLKYDNVEKEEIV